MVSLCLARVWSENEVKEMYMVKFDVIQIVREEGRDNVKLLLRK